MRTEQPGAARPSTLRRRIERSFKRGLTRILLFLVKPVKVNAADVRRSEVRRLLLIRQHNQMGDMVLSLPALNAWRQSYPQAQLSFLTAPLCEELLECYPGIDSLLVYKKNEMWYPWKLIAFFLKVKNLHADLVVVMGSVSFSMTSALLAWLSGARLRIGVGSTSHGSNLSQAMYHYELSVGPQGVHEVEHNLLPLKELGLDIEDSQPRLFATPRAKELAHRFLRAGSKDSTKTTRQSIVVMHVGAGKRPNIWAAERFATVGRELIEQHDVQLVLTQGPSDRPSVDAVCELLEGLPVCRWQEKLGDTLGVLQAADLVVSNDTGMAHVAAALGVATIVLFGPTDAHQWSPRGQSVSVVRSTNDSMEGISAAEVLQKANDCLSSSAAFKP